MRALVVFESVFGNTKYIAESIVEGFGPGVAATIVEAKQSEALPQDDIDLVVVGAPTHAFGLPRPGTRKGALQQAPDKAVIGDGVREWLDKLPAASPGILAATFDTRVVKPRWLPGSAARKAASRLRRLGYQVLATESFFVVGTQGPLSDGELERARMWAARLARLVDTAHR